MDTAVELMGGGMYMYAQFRDMGLLPLSWEQVEYLGRQLSRISPGDGTSYQVIYERKMFALDIPEFRVTIVRWTNQWPRKEREEIGEFTDPIEIVGVMKLLIGVVEDQMVANSRRPVEMILSGALQQMHIVLGTSGETNGR